ncbi:MAG: ribonuclease E activity regulator RraA [Methylococcaceae bacterium]|jgi:regulator of ribonuclease activity A
MSFSTADLCDRYSEQAHFQIAEPLFKAYGGKTEFNGQITTLKVFEDNVLIRQTLEEPGEQRVLVVDGGGSHRCALVGDNLANLALNNGWQGLLIYGCIRDAQVINQLPIGIRALHTHPLKSHKKGLGERDGVVTFAGVNFKKEHYLYADIDGIIVSETLLR